MNESTIALLLTRIQRGLIEIVLQPNTTDLWRLPHVDPRNELRTNGTVTQWLALTTPFTQVAKLAELQDSLSPQRFVHLYTIHDAETELPPPMEWFNLQDLPPLAFLNEKRLFDEHAREITERIIAHQNPYKLVPGFR
jgi:hypothetical protein